MGHLISKVFFHLLGLLVVDRLVTVTTRTANNFHKLDVCRPAGFCDAGPLSGFLGSGWWRLSLFMLEKGWDINVIMKYFLLFFWVFPACATRAEKTQTLGVLLCWVKFKKNQTT